MFEDIASEDTEPTWWEQNHQSVKLLLGIVGALLAVLVVFIAVNQPTNPEARESSAAAAIGSIVFMLVIGLIGLVFYFLPMIVALKRDHPSLAGIALLNIFFGWSLIGWFAALIWCVSAFESRTLEQETENVQPAQTPGEFSVCPKCNLANPANNHYCSRCGEKIF